jgi:hypothetical protein
VGARRRERLAEARAAPHIELIVDDLAQIERAVPFGAATGDRYPTQAMADLDSEQGQGSMGWPRRFWRQPRQIEGAQRAGHGALRRERWIAKHRNSKRVV